jgi:hypothetical protein
MKLNEGKKRITVPMAKAIALLGPLGWALPSLLLSAIAVVVAFALGARDVQLSAKAMLERVG